MVSPSSHVGAGPIVGNFMPIAAAAGDSVMTWIHVPLTNWWMVTLGKWSNAANQLFSLELADDVAATDGHQFRVVTVAGGQRKVLASAAFGATRIVTLQDWTGAANQRWWIDRLNDLDARMMCVETHEVIDVRTEGGASMLVMDSWTDGARQAWRTLWGSDPHLDVCQLVNVTAERFPWSRSRDSVRLDNSGYAEAVPGIEVLNANAPWNWFGFYFRSYVPDASIDRVVIIINDKEVDDLHVADPAWPNLWSLPYPTAKLTAALHYSFRVDLRRGPAIRSVSLGPWQGGADGFGSPIVFAPLDAPMPFGHAATEYPIHPPPGDQIYVTIHEPLRPPRIVLRWLQSATGTIQFIQPGDEGVLRVEMDQGPPITTTHQRLVNFGEDISFRIYSQVSVPRDTRVAVSTPQGVLTIKVRISEGPR